MMLRSLTISICAAGLALAQTTATPGPGTPGGRRGPRPNPGFSRGINLFGPNAEARLTRQFALNATEQNTLHLALASAQVQQQGMREKETTLRTQLGASVKAADEAGIERAAADLETLRRQQTAIHAKTLATIYSSLDATQKAKFEPLMNRELGLPGPVRGPAGAGRGPRPRGTQQQTPQQ